jgi:hypothetical protein
VRLEHHGVVAGGEQAGGVRGAGPFYCIPICPLDVCFLTLTAE